MNPIFVFKKPAYDQQSHLLAHDLTHFVGIQGLTSLRIGLRYDLQGVPETLLPHIGATLLSQPQTDQLFLNSLPTGLGSHSFGVRYLPAQYDQSADSLLASLNLLVNHSDLAVVSSKVIFLDGNLSSEDLAAIKSYCINQVDSYEIGLEDPITFSMPPLTVDPLPEHLTAFNSYTPDQLTTFGTDQGLAMSTADLLHCQTYFRDTEQRPPTYTEIKVIDTYWSDHCRHTTFGTKLREILIEDGPLSDRISASYTAYQQSRQNVYGEKSATRDQSLMDLATIGMKELRKDGHLDNLDISEEINACGIHINVEVDGQQIPYLLLFKNETHNHPTEIEPFGGASTCLGGAIRDPLSGRGYVFGAIRVTGAADPRTPFAQTLVGKLPQRKITRVAAAGYSSYANQIGATTAKVKEFYHPGFMAKRMECGAVLGAVPLSSVQRTTPQPGDCILLVGGPTGKDGIGGATGSSQNQTEESLATGGSQVQKGNPTEERKIVRFMRDPIVSKMIKRCNDFGAGGVAVAIGELCDGLEVNLNAVPLKYPGMTATDITISESQERMAMVIAPENLESFIQHAAGENLSAVQVATVTDHNRLTIRYNGTPVVDLARSFLDTNGVTPTTDVVVKAPTQPDYFAPKPTNLPLTQLFTQTMTSLDHCSNCGLVEQFDATAGGNTILHPLGGATQSTESEGLAMTIPLLDGQTTDTAALMSYGYNPNLMDYSPYLGSQYAVVESIARLVAMGADPTQIRLTFQEYFEAVGTDPSRWGKPFSALLGAHTAQLALKCGSVGGKDSMSGSFENIDVPPTLLSFAVAPTSAKQVVSQDIKPDQGGELYLLYHTKNADHTPNYPILEQLFDYTYQLASQGRLIAATSINAGGLIKALSNSCYGNRAGVTLRSETCTKTLLVEESYGSILVQATDLSALLLQDITTSFTGVEILPLGTINNSFQIILGEETVDLAQLQQQDNAVLAEIFPTKPLTFTPKEPLPIPKVEPISYKVGTPLAGKPQVFIPIFPGFTGEWSLANQFQKAGGAVSTFVFKNATYAQGQQSLEELAALLKTTQILALPGGISMGDEPDGPAKHLITAFQSPILSQALAEFLARDTLTIGVGNGFQALVGLGLLPYGKLTLASETTPTFTQNVIGRHTARYETTLLVSTASPWLSQAKLGQQTALPISHGFGRLVLTQTSFEELSTTGQILSLYTNPQSGDGSDYAVEALTSPNGRIFGRMAYSDRLGDQICKNIPNQQDQQIFKAGINYFK